MIGTSGGQQFNSQLDYLLGNSVNQTENTSNSPRPVIGNKSTTTGSADARDAVVIRHGDTHYTEDDLAHGWSKEGLTPQGREEVAKYADLKDKPDVLVSSDLPRAMESADIISKKTGIPIAEAHQGLRTWDIGDLQGKPCKDVDPKLAKLVNNPDKPAPNGESFNSFKDRVMSGVQDIMDRFPGQKVGLVTHSKVQRLLNAYDSTGGQYVDHDHFNTAAESPGHEKTMKLAMPQGSTEFEEKPRSVK